MNLGTEHYAMLWKVIRLIPTRAKLIGECSNMNPLLSEWKTLESNGSQICSRFRLNLWPMEGAGMDNVDLVWLGRRGKRSMEVLTLLMYQRKCRLVPDRYSKWKGHIVMNGGHMSACQASVWNPRFHTNSNDFQPTLRLNGLTCHGFFQLHLGESCPKMISLLVCKEIRRRSLQVQYVLFFPL